MRHANDGLFASGYCGCLGCSCTAQPIGCSCSPKQLPPRPSRFCLPRLFGLRLHSQPIGCTDLPFPVFSVLRFRRIRVSRGLACSRVWCPSRCPRLRPRARSPALGGAESSRRRLRHPSTIDVGAHSWAASATLRGFCHPFRRYPPLAGVPRGDGKPHAPQPRTLLTPLWRSSRPAKICH